MFVYVTLLVIVWFSSSVDGAWHSQPFDLRELSRRVLSQPSSSMKDRVAILRTLRARLHGRHKGQAMNTQVALAAPFLRTVASAPSAGRPSPFRMKSFPIQKLTPMWIVKRGKCYQQYKTMIAPVSGWIFMMIPLKWISAKCLMKVQLQ